MLSCTLIYSLFAVFLLFVCVFWSDLFTMSQNDSNPICDAIMDNCDYIDLVDVSNLTYTKKDLLAMQLNIRGLMSKQDSLKYLLNEFQTLPDIVLLCETWLKRDTESNIHMPGYKCYHKHRSDR